MRKMIFFCILFVLSIVDAYGFNRLDDKYCVSYGSPKAPVHVIQYYSFKCPHCLELFKSDFKIISEKYISKGEIFWVFHPAPLDLLTLHGMHCISNLSDGEKKILFLGSILQEIDLDDFDYSYQIMVRAMEVLGNPNGAVKVQEDLKGTGTFQDATKFVLQDDRLESVPHIQVNGEDYPDQIPDLEFVENLIKRIKK